MLHAGHSSTQVRSVITITGLGDHDQPDWLITMTGMRSFGVVLDYKDDTHSVNRPVATR